MEHEQAIRNLAVECYLLGEMTPGEREAFEEHYFECAICGEDVRAASQFMEDMKRTLEAGRDAARTTDRAARKKKQSGWTWPAWLQPQLAAAAIVVLAAVAGVETISTIPGLRRQVDEANAPRIAKYQVLRPQTRGAAMVLTAPPGGSAVLVFDLPEFSPLLAARGLQFVVKSTDGRVVFAVIERSLESGDPVTLSIPKLDLPAGSYTLLVETVPDTGKSGQELGQYPFEIKRQ